ncbi:MULTISPECIES: hypothetical protein [unclassified Streptomyces]|uniref:hypothetical protein n=1 Tax=unclassified Streptomyces TaxID=2593676 RepID=UPI0037F1AF80
MEDARGDDRTAFQKRPFRPDGPARPAREGLGQAGSAFGRVAPIHGELIQTQVQSKNKTGQLLD